MVNYKKQAQIDYEEEIESMNYFKVKMQDYIAVGGMLKNIPLINYVFIFLLNFRTEWSPEADRYFGWRKYPRQELRTVHDSPNPQNSVIFDNNTKADSD